MPGYQFCISIAGGLPDFLFCIFQSVKQRYLIRSCPFQDSRGVIWIGTFSGLNRYDGKGSLHGLLRLDVGTTLGLMKYEPASDAFVRVAGLEGKFITCIDKNINGDGIYGDRNDYVFQGRSQTPKIFYGFTLNIGWKGIDFSYDHYFCDPERRMLFQSLPVKDKGKGPESVLFRREPVYIY